MCSTETWKRILDHTLLDGNARAEDIVEACRRAVELEVHGVAVPSSWVALCQSTIAEEKKKKAADFQPPAIVAIVGYPYGNANLSAKLAEARQAVSDGASWIEFVANGGLLTSGNNNGYVTEFRNVVALCRGLEVRLRAVLNMQPLALEEKAMAFRLAHSAGISHFQPTTGWDHDCANPDDVAILRQLGGAGISIKASGGIFNLDAARWLLQSGANWLGGNASVIIAQASAERRRPGFRHTG